MSSTDWKGVSWKVYPHCSSHVRQLSPRVCRKRVPSLWRTQAGSNLNQEVKLRDLIKSLKGLLNKHEDTERSVDTGRLRCIDGKVSWAHPTLYMENDQLPDSWRKGNSTFPYEIIPFLLVSFAVCLWKIEANWSWVLPQCVHECCLSAWFLTLGCTAETASP